MAFTPPVFSTLVVNTHNLNSKYSTLMGRYKIVDNASNSAPSLQILIARMDELVKVDTQRTGARNALGQLSNEFRPLLEQVKAAKEDKAFKQAIDEKVAHGALILLGGLIHRYFRIISEYNTGLLAFFSSSSPRNCALFNAVRKALQLKPIDSRADESEYRQGDLDTLDVVTIVNALKAFQEYMLLEDEKKKPQYKRYEHFADENRNFKFYLQAIIEAQCKRGEFALKQFKAIAFLQSLSAQLEKIQQQIEQGLDKWIDALSKSHKELGSLTVELMEQHIKTHVQDECLRERILDLLFVKHILDTWQSYKDYASFLSEMKTCSRGRNTWTLIGGYVLLLNSNGLDKSLIYCMQDALDLGKNPDVFTPEDSYNSILFLNEYLKDNESSNLNTEYFGQRELMKTRIAQTELQLADAVSRTTLPPGH